MTQDPGELRGAPLGWSFPLFFIIQGLMPVGAAFGLAFTLSDWLAQVGLLLGGVALSALILFFLGRAALRGRARVERFRAAYRGPRCLAQVLEVVHQGGAGMVRRGGVRTSYVKLWTRMLAQPVGRAPFELAGEACYTSVEQDGLVPGARVWVALHPTEAGAFIVLPGSVPAQPSSPRGAAPRGLDVM